MRPNTQTSDQTVVTSAQTIGENQACKVIYETDSAFDVDTVQQKIEVLYAESLSSQLQSKIAEAVPKESCTSHATNSEGSPRISQITEDTAGTELPKRTQKLVKWKTPKDSDSSHCSRVVPTALKRSGSESDSFIKRRRYSRTIVTEESMDESDIEPGVIEFRSKTTSSISLEAHEAEKIRRALMTRPSTSTGSFTEVVPFPAETRILPYYHLGLEEWDETKYKYIDKKIILAVARQLGRNGELVIRQLGVPDHIVAVASERRGKDIVGFFLDCLIQWCEMKMEEANPDILKAALAENDRQDLVQLVDDHLSGKSGYMTN